MVVALDDPDYVVTIQVMIDIVGTQPGFERALKSAAEHYGLDAEALIAAANAALAAPNRPIELDVGVRVAA